MKKSSLTILAILVLAVAFAGSVMAQGRACPPNERLTWDVKAGVMWPSGPTRDTSEFTAGVEVGTRASNVFQGAQGNLSLSADYVNITTTAEGGGTKDTVLLPVLLNWKGHYYFGQGSSVDYGLGAGIYWATDTIPDMNITDRVNFAYGVSLGFHFTPNWFVEGRWMASRNADKDALAALTLGYTF
jgi:hypothetical protein